MLYLLPMQSVLRFRQRADSCSFVNSVIPVSIHESVFPARVELRLREAFRTRRIDPKFHYLSARQARAWLALAQACSPFLAKPTGTRVYDSAYQWLLERLRSKAVHVISLACGGAQKEARLVRLLTGMGNAPKVTITDASLPLVIKAYRSLHDTENVADLNAFLLDVMETGDPTECLAHNDSAETVRIITCFGLLPNVDPCGLASRLASLLRNGDVLLVSANMACESGYRQNVETLRRQYDNPDTREWLLLLLLDVGFERNDGEIMFQVEPYAAWPELLQIVAVFRAARNRLIRWGDEELAVSANEEFRIFFSNRCTPELVRKIFNAHGIHVCQEWMSPEDNEGVFAVVRSQE